MADLHWYGRAVCRTLALRDELVEEFQNLLNGSMEVTEHPHGDLPAGITTSNNVNGSEFNGPGFAWSLKVSHGVYFQDPANGGVSGEGETLYLRMATDDNVELINAGTGAP
jgi:hypothetical protein